MLQFAQKTGGDEFTFVQVRSTVRTGQVLEQWRCSGVERKDWLSSALTAVPENELDLPHLVQAEVAGQLNGLTDDADHVGDGLCTERRGSTLVG